MKALVLICAMLGLSIVLAGCDGKKEEQVPGVPSVILPEPRRLGKCNRVIEQYLPNNFWKGYDECVYRGWMWDCPSASDEQSECHRRVNGQLPPEKP